MQLIVVRHAKAKQRDSKLFPDDSIRPLSAPGRKEFSKFADRLSRWLEPPTIVFASRWTRAWQTAFILEKKSRWPGAQRCAELETEGGFAAVELLLQLIRAQMHQERIALIGHEPVLGELITRLMGANETTIDVAKGAVAVLEIISGEALRAKLLALVPPTSLVKRIKKNR